MKNDILVTATALSDQDLLARLDVLASKEREASVELVATLAALDSRPALYAARGYGSLFSYCTQALRLSEDAACNRIAAARACLHFPLILDLLASGSLNLTSVRLLGRHLTAENQEAVLAKAENRTNREIEALVAELAPRPDVPSTVRKLPCPKAAPAAGPVPAVKQATPDLEVNAPSPIPLPAAHRPVGRILGVDVLTVELVDPRFYHLDTCFCPLAPGEAIWYPEAFDAYGRKVLQSHVQRLLAVKDSEANRFGCNAIVVGKTVVTNTGCEQLEADLRAWGYTPIAVELDEFLKAGGSAKCLTLRLDGEDAAVW